MKKQELNLISSKNTIGLFSKIIISVFVLLTLSITMLSAKTVPNIIINDNVLVDESVESTIVFPSNRTGANAVIACGVWPQTGDGYPAPSHTGEPSSSDCGNISFSYVDSKIDSCSDNAYNIERTWTVIDSCDANAVVVMVQTVDVDDNIAPVTIVPADFSVVVPQYECLVDIPAPPILVSLECSGWDYSVAYKYDSTLVPTLSAGVVRLANSTYLINDIVADSAYIVIVYTTADSCGNDRTDEVLVLIDNSANTGANALRIDGARVTCVGASDNYNIPDLAGASYAWSVVSGGVINGPSNTAGIVVDWGLVPSAANQVTVQLTTVTGCVFTDTINVLVGTDIGSVAVRGDINFSLGASCSLLVTPAMVAAGPLPADGAFEVVLMDDDGNEITDAILTGEYVGWPLMIILRNVCSGNSAMGTGLVFDKMGPVIACNDIELYCHQMDLDNGPVVVDNCGGDVTLNLIDSNYVVKHCDNNYVAEINKTYIAYDEYGNESLPCSYTVFLKRYPLDSLIAPDNFMNIDTTALICGTYEKNLDGSPAVSVTGSPTLNGVGIYPSVSQFCNVGIGYVDNIINPSLCNTKIMRTWTIYESWCTIGDFVEFQQVIEIRDTVAPVVACLSSMSVTTNGNSCNGTVLLPAITASDDCSNNLTYDVAYPGGVLLGQNGGVVQLLLGNNEIVYTVTDECFNQTICRFNVLVQDLTPPVPVLFENITVSLTEDGTAWYPVDNFDAGSYDDCAILNLDAMRMDEGAPCNRVDSTFEENLHFCCADAGSSVQVIVRVTDIAGNVNTAMVFIEVQDKSEPNVICPANDTVTCGYVFNFEDLSGFGTPIVEDACDDSYTETLFTNISTCGIGYIERTFIAADGETSCTQRITIEAAEAFLESSIDWSDDYFPTDACLDSDLHPNNLIYPYGYPQTNVQVCKNVGFSFKDTKYTVSNACYKIVRRWKATDLCNVSDTVYYHEQTIMVSNSVAPDILNSCDSIVSYTQGCIGGYLELNSSADDDCTDNEDLFNTYRIDLFNDGSFETDIQGVGASMTVSDTFPLGHHKILWIYEDKCGNQSSCEQIFSIINNKLPIAYCYDDIAISLGGMDLDGDGEIDTEMACIEAYKFDAGSSHECGYEVKVSFSQNVNDTLLCVTCTDIGNYPIDLWVTDENGGQSLCTTTLFVQDNNDIEICQPNCDMVEWPTDNFEVNICGDDISAEAIGSEPIIPIDSPCQTFTATYTDSLVNYSTTDCTFLIRSWVVEFTCGSVETCDYQQTIIRNNYIAPLITCGVDIIVTTLGSSCNTPVDVPDLVIEGNCSTGLIVINDFNNTDDASGDYPVGTTQVTYIVSDDCDNADTCVINVTVLDIGNPDCITQDITIELDADGTYTLSASEVNNGSLDPCSGLVLAENMSVAPNTFDCEDAGTIVEVTLTITDDSGNESTCTANVTINDGSDPICSANQFVELHLDENGTVSVPLSLIDNNSGTACGGDVVVSISPTFLECDAVGDTTVIQLTVTANEITVVCEGSVIVRDTISPICNTQNVTVNVGEIILAANINNGSTDNCTADTSLVLSVTPNVFDCDDVGTPQTVTLSVTDEYGNTSTCTATVTVEDDGAPICNAQDIEVVLDADGNVTIVAADVDDNSVAACAGGGVTLAVDPSSFDCTNIGENTVTLTVTSDNGLSSTCEAIVTVTDTLAPICNTQNVTVNVGEILLAVNINNGSTDNCTADTSLVLSVTPNVFDCDDVGTPQTVTLSVTDEYGNTSTCTATITVEDDGAPICSTQDIEVVLDADGNVTILAADVDDNSSAACNGGTVTLAVDPSSFDCTNIGENTVTLTVTSDNGFSSTCEAIVTVLDTLAPICNAQDITVELDSFGLVIINAEDLDNGSTDNCDTSLTFTVEPLSFTCDSIGDNSVILTVTDDSGNFSTCTATVTVTEGVAPACSTQNITVALGANGTVSITADEVDNGSTGGSCGGTVSLSVSPSDFTCANVGDNIVTLTVTVNGLTSTCAAVVTVTEDIAPEVSCPDDQSLTCNEYNSDYSTFGSATATDNCDVDVVITESFIENINSCDVGTVTRTFIATDDAGNSDTCTQVLTFALGNDPLQFSDIDFPTTPVNIFNCADTDPSNTGTPTVQTQNADCSAVSIDFEDVVVQGPGGSGAGSTAGDGCNDIITRTWTIIDTCQFDGNGAGVFVFNQTINVIDDEAPIIDGPDDVTLELTVPNCDGNIDLSDVTITDCHDYTVVNTSPYATDNNGADASGEYPEGETTFFIIATDLCGNVSTDTVTVTLTTVEDQFNCFKLFFIMDDDLNVLINSYSFVDNVYGCSFENGDLTFSFSNTDEDQFLDTLTCAEVGFFVPIHIYAYIDGIVIDSCVTVAHLSDPNSFCPTSLFPGIGGAVFTTGFESIEGVNVGLEGGETIDYMTDDSGIYEFMEVEKSSSYLIKPFKDDDHLNGVSTLDLLLIQRHILGYKKFESPYQMIAADVNKNGSINGLDLINIRKLLLGKIDHFTDNTSWRFIDANHEEMDVNTVLDDYLPENYYINSLDNMMYINWYGVKIGDVNNSVESNSFTTTTQDRFNETNILVVDDQMVKKGEEFVVHLNTANDQSVFGFQFTLSFDPNMAEYLDIESSDIEITKDFIGDNYANRGHIAVSWNDVNKVELATGDNVMSLRFIAKKDMKLSSCFDIDSKLLAAEWYSDHTAGMKLVFNSVEGAEVQLISNVPNPWSDQTDINFFLPSDMEVEFVVYDVNGRKLMRTKDNYPSGLNTIILDKSQIGVGGVLYYEIKTSGTKIVKKMILLNK